MRSCFKENADYLWRQSQLAAAHAELLLLKASHRRETKYDPDQPRVPAGNADGGQWMSDDGSGEVSFSARSRPASYLLASSGSQSAAYCWNQMQIDMLYCSTRPRTLIGACRAQANERYAACLTGKPLPPLLF